jgi:hypothetical protein
MVIALLAKERGVGVDPAEDRPPPVPAVEQEQDRQSQNGYNLRFPSEESEEEDHIMPEEQTDVPARN